MPEYVLAGDLALLGQEDVKTGAEAFDGTGFSQEDIETGAEAFGLTGFGQEGVPPWTRTPLYALEGMGQVKSDPKVVAAEIRRLLEPKAVVAFLNKETKRYSDLLARRQKIAVEQLRKAGLISDVGMGHVMTAGEAFTRGISYWSPRKAAEEHNLKHKTGEFVIFSNFSTTEIKMVKERNWSQYEMEHMTPALFKGELESARMKLPPAVPKIDCPSPPEAAKEKLQETVGGQMVGYGVDAAEAAGRIAGKAADAAKTLWSGFEKVLPYLPYIGVGVVGLIALPYVLSAVKAAKGLKASLTPTRGTS